MIDITKEEYEKVVAGIVEKIHQLNKDDTAAWVRRQIPLDTLRESGDDDNLEIGYKIIIPAQDIIEFVRTQRK